MFISESKAILIIFGCAGSLDAAWALLFFRGVWVSDYGGFSCCEAHGL